MSKLTEYLKLIPKGLQHPKEVIEGWINDYNFEDLPEDQIQEILRRRAICESCPFNSVNAKTSKEYFDIFGVNYETDRNDEHCSLCGCPYKKKTASLDSECAISQEPKTEHLPLKWTKYEV